MNAFFNNMGLGRRLYRGLFLIVPILVTLLTAAYPNLARLTNAIQWHGRACQVWNENGQIQESLIDMETGVRGYALAGWSDPLQPYRKGGEIKDVIGDTAGKMATGSRLVATPGHTMERIVGNELRVSEIVTALSDARSGPQAGIVQPHQVVTEMDGITRQNAALAAEAAASAVTYPGTLPVRRST